MDTSISKAASASSASAIVRFAILLWASLLLLGLVHPFPISHVALAPLLRRGFGISAATFLLISINMGLFAALMLGGHRDEEDATQAQSIRSFCGFAGAALAASVFLSLVLEAQRWGKTNGVVPYVSALAFLFVASLMGGALSWVLRNVVTSAIRRALAIVLTLIGTAYWFSQAIGYLSPLDGLERQSILGFIGLALALALFNAMVHDSRALARRSLRVAELGLGILAPILVF